MPTTYTTIGQIIELSVAPAFLLVAMGSFINVATLRLGRVVDRARVLEASLASDDPAAKALHIEELHALQGRIMAANRAIIFATFAALLVCGVVATLFVSVLGGFDTQLFIAGLFVGCMALTVTALGFFLREILIATRSLVIRTDVLMPGREDDDDDDDAGMNG